MELSTSIRKTFVDMICGEIDSVERVKENSFCYDNTYEIRVQSWAGGTFYSLRRMATYNDLHGFDAFAEKFFRNHCENIMNALAEEEQE